MTLLVINAVSLFVLWLFAFMGIKHFEFAQQDKDTGYMKFLIHLILVGVVSYNVYNYYSTVERSQSVPSTPMVEENKK